MHRRIVSSVRYLKATTIPGDGVGPEILKSARSILKAANVPIQFDTQDISEVGKRTENFHSTVSSIKSTRVCLKGPLVSDSSFDLTDLASLNFKLHKKLDLFATVSLINSLEGIKFLSKSQNIVNGLDIAIIRQRTEGEYSAIEHETVKGVVENLKITTVKKAEQIARYAFDFAVKNGRKEVCCVHKANIMKLGDGLFRKTCERVSEEYPNIKYTDMIVDNACMQMVSNPHQFDVIVTPNLYGNVLTNVASGLVGGAGVVPSYSVSDNCMVYEPAGIYAHHTAVGKNVANPTAMILCAALMADHMGYKMESKRIVEAVKKTYRVGKVITTDVGGFATTDEFTGTVIENM